MQCAWMVACMHASMSLSLIIASASHPIWVMTELNVHMISGQPCFCLRDVIAKETQYPEVDRPSKVASCRQVAPDAHPYTVVTLALNPAFLRCMQVAQHALDITLPGLHRHTPATGNPPLRLLP